MIEPCKSRGLQGKEIRVTASNNKKLLSERLFGAFEFRQERGGKREGRCVCVGGGGAGGEVDPNTPPKYRPASQGSKYSRAKKKCSTEEG